MAKQVTSETDEEENTSEEDKKTKTQQEEKSIPIPAPRCSTRPKKPPDRFGDFVSKMMSPQPIDSKIHALGKLMRSDVLNNVDSDTAHRLIAAIMK